MPGSVIKCEAKGKQFIIADKRLMLCIETIKKESKTG
jgi:hypothetical protein